MNTFIKGLASSNNSTETANGDLAYKSTLNSNLDFYGISGNINQPFDNLYSVFKKALFENTDLALRNLLNMRDIRGGKGVRDDSRKLLNKLFTDKDIRNTEYDVFMLLSRFVSVGRWDDLLSLYGFDGELNQLIVFYYKQGLGGENPALCAKWTPLNQKDDTSKKFIAHLRKDFGMTPKQLRKYIVSKRGIVETKMCENKWDEIEYSHVPSKAMSIYKGAFVKHSEDKFKEYLDKVSKGESKINSSTLFPHEITGNLYKDITEADELQWKALPNFIKDGVGLFPTIDVSPSMETFSYSGYSCLDVAVGLGLYLADKNKSVFKNSFITFSGDPEVVVLSDSNLSDKVKITRKSNWGGTTDIAKAFELILDSAVSNQLKQEDLPEYLVVLSDMQFDGSGSRNVPMSVDVLNKFKDVELTPPKMVWWNLSSSYKNKPVVFDQNGNCFVSGFSPSVLTAILSDEIETFTPENVMMKDLMQDKYKIN